MKTLNIENLRRAIAWVRQNVKPEQFRFSIVALCDEHGCKTVACFMGWMPEAFPEKRIENFSQAFSVEGGIVSFPALAVSLFGMAQGVLGDLFSPNNQQKVNLKLPQCDIDATPEEVCTMLEQFIALYESGEIKF